MVSHVDGPDARACPDVEDLLGVLYGCQVQSLVEREQVHVVCEVEYLLCGLVVGAPICAISVCVVLAAVLDAVVQDVGREGISLVAHEAAAVKARV